MGATHTDERDPACPSVRGLPCTPATLGTPLIFPKFVPWSAEGSTNGFNPHKATSPTAPTAVNSFFAQAAARLSSPGVNFPLSKAVSHLTTALSPEPEEQRSRGRLYLVPSSQPGGGGEVEGEEHRHSSWDGRPGSSSEPTETRDAGGPWPLSWAESPKGCWWQAERLDPRTSQALRGGMPSSRAPPGGAQHPPRRGQEPLGNLELAGGPAAAA